MSNTISRAAQGLAASLDASLQERIGELVTWFLVIYTDDRATYVGSGDRFVFTALMQAVLDRWNGTSPRVVLGQRTRLHSVMLANASHLLDGLRDALYEVAGQPVAFSLIIADPPNPPMYLGYVGRDDARRELTALLDAWEEGMPDVQAHEVH